MKTIRPIRFYSIILVGFTAICVRQNANAGTVIVQHSTLEGSIGLPVNFTYDPGWYVVTDPFNVISLGVRPHASLGGTFLDVKCNGAANLAANQNPGWNTLSLVANSGTATMNLGLTAGLDLELIAFGDTVTGSLFPDQTPVWGFFDNRSYSSYLLNNPVTLSGTISHGLVSINTLDALTIEFGIVIPSWLAGINLNVNADVTLSQTI